MTNSNEIIDNLYESNVAKRLSRVVELRREARKAKCTVSLAKVERIIERLLQRKIAQVDAALEEGAENCDRLADYILHHELYDRTPYKIANTEYPFMNERMFDERKAKDTGEIAIQAEQERKTIGGRRKRSRYENALMDRKHRAHNAELRRRYNDFKAGRSEGMLRVEIGEGALPDGYWMSEEAE